MNSHCRLLSSSYYPGPWRTPLPVIAALCLRPQKNQPHWLASSTSDSTSPPSHLFFSPPPHFPVRLTPFSLLFKLQVASNPA
jgi:hypothetical protein